MVKNTPYNHFLFKHIKLFNNYAISIPSQNRHYIYCIDISAKGEI